MAYPHRALRMSLWAVLPAGLLALASQPVFARSAGIPLAPKAIHEEITGSITFSFGNEQVSEQFTGNADINLTWPDISMRTHLDQPGALGEDTLIIGDTEYTRTGDGLWRARMLSAEDRKAFAWLALPEPGETLPSPDEQVRLLEQFGVQVTRLPDEQVGDVPVRHERIDGTVAQFGAIATTLPLTFGTIAGLLPDSEDLADLPADTRVSVEVWMGVADRFPHRLSMWHESDGVRFETTIDFTPLPEPVELVAPVVGPAPP